MTSCGDIVTCVTTFWPIAFDIAFSAIAIASAITALTPTPRDDEWVGKIYRMIDMLALNVGYAKDKPRAGGRFVPE